MAPKLAIIGDPSRADNFLAHRIATELKRAVRREQQGRQTSIVDLAPFALGSFSTWEALVRMPILRVQSNFPVTCTVMHSLQEQAIQIIGMTCLEEQMDTHLSPEELRQAAEVRSLMIIELQHLPVFIENKFAGMGTATTNRDSSGPRNPELGPGHPSVTLRQWPTILMRSGWGTCPTWYNLTD